MAITEQHYETATRLLAEHHPSTDSHSDTYWQGYLDAVAWHLAGQPLPLHTRNSLSGRVVIWLD